MKKTITTPLILITLLFSSLGLFAQAEGEKLSLDSGTIENQFDYVIKESNPYQDYKVVKNGWLQKLKTHVADTLQEIHQELSETHGVVTSQNSEIDALQADLKSINDKLNEVENEKESINFLGNQMNKQSYKILMWSIIGALLSTLLFFIFRFFRSNMITTETNKTLADTQASFEEFKKRSLMKEQKLKRELQDELNRKM